MNVCPIILEPIPKPKIWGGRNLERLLGKALPPDEPIGETWECADLEAAQSVVARGPARGKTLHELVETWGKDLLGRAEPVDGRFPLLLKFLDAAQDLSIQVHPDPETARRLGGAVRVKHEAWHILDAIDGAVIYRGLRPGVAVADLADAVRADPAAIVSYLNRIPVKSGQTYYLPSGTLHALGAGVVVAEVQTPSDITYRLYDWGRARPEADAGLHIDEALACIRTDLDPAVHERKSHVAGIFTTVTRCVTCPSFVIEKVRFIGGIEQEIPYAELVCWMVLEGSGEIRYGRGGGKGGRGAGSGGSGSDSGGGSSSGVSSGGSVETFARGDVVILPASLDSAVLQTTEDCVWLEVTVPAESDLAGYARPQREQSTASGEKAADTGVPLNINKPRPSP